MTVQVFEVDDGVLLPVKALPGSGSNGIKGCHDGAVKIAVTQVAEKGKANKAIIQELSRWLSLPKSRIELHSGSSNARKRFLLRHVDLHDIQKTLDTLS